MPKTITLEPWEINLVLKALADRPYKDVASTIQSIKDQLQQQENAPSEQGGAF